MSCVISDLQKLPMTSFQLLHLILFHKPSSYRVYNFRIFCFCAETILCCPKFTLKYLSNKKNLIIFTQVILIDVVCSIFFKKSDAGYISAIFHIESASDLFDYFAQFCYVIQIFLILKYT